MKAVALVALSVLTDAGSCDSTASEQTTPEPERSFVTGADPGGFLPSVCLGQDDLRAWRRAEPTNLPIGEPRMTSPGSECEWVVVMRNGIPIVFADRKNRHALPAGFSRADTSDYPRAVQKGRAGVLLGFDGGEWGGSLRWYSENGALKQQLLDSNVVAILPAFGQFVALTYVGHGSHGRVVEVRDGAGRFDIGRAIDLPRPPYAGGVEADGTILVVTGEGLFRLSPDLQITQLLEANWWMLHPVSLAIPHRNTVYVGMRGIVVEVQLSTTPPRETWLYPF